MITNKAFFKRNEARIGAEFLLKKALFVIINLSQNPHYICVSSCKRIVCSVFTKVG